MSVLSVRATKRSNRVLRTEFSGAAWSEGGGERESKTKEISMKNIGVKVLEPNNLKLQTNKKTSNNKHEQPTGGGGEKKRKIKKKKKAQIKSVG